MAKANGQVFLNVGICIILSLPPNYTTKPEQLLRYWKDSQNTHSAFFFSILFSLYPDKAKLNNHAEALMASAGVGRKPIKAMLLQHRFRPFCVCRHCMKVCKQ